MRFVWIFLALSSWQIIASNSIECYKCSNSDGTNCLTGNCTSSSICLTEFCPDGGDVNKICGSGLFKYEYCEYAKGCVLCRCGTDYCNNDIPKPLKDIKCAEYNESGVERDTCDAYTCQVEACTPRYSSGVEMRTKIKGNCFDKTTESFYRKRLANGCTNVSVTEDGVTLDCTRCNCDTENCNSELPDDVKKYHEMLLEPPKTTTTTPIPTTTPPPSPTPSTVAPDHSEVMKPNGLLICSVLVVITEVWTNTRG